MTRVADDKRKKKRASRGRTGCLTCRERRVKCDEGKPTCQRCLTIGRVCKGYETLPLHWKSIEATNNRDRQSSWTSTSGSSPDSKQDDSSPNSYDSHPITIIESYSDSERGLVQRPKSPSPPSDYEWSFYYCPSIFDSDSQRAINFFNERTINQIGSWFSRPLWSEVPKIAYSESSIRHAVIALSNFHEQYSTRFVPPSALKYYMLAIKELREGIPTTAGILCLMMFFAIELLQRSYSSAMQLFRVARRMMFDIRFDSSDLYMFLRNLIRRIDKQITEICGTIDPDLTYNELWGEEPFMSRNLSPKEEFKTFRDAYDAFIHILEGWFNDPQPDHQHYLDRIRAWQQPFDRFKIRKDLDEMSIKKIPGLEVFRRHYELLISKTRDAPIPQTWWDQHEDLLNETIDFLKLDPDMNRGTSFGLEHCLVYQLFNIGRDCRSPVIRRRVINWIRSLNMQEGVLTGDLVVKVLGKVLRVEECGLTIRNSSEIPENRRIQEVRLDFNEEVKKMRYRLDDTWYEESLDGV